MPDAIRSGERRPDCLAAETKYLWGMEGSPKEILSRSDPSIIVGFCGI